MTPATQAFYDGLARPIYDKYEYHGQGTKPTYVPGARSVMQDRAMLEARLSVLRGHRLVPCGYSEPESDYRDYDTGAHRTARCEGGRLVVRGNGIDSTTDGTIWMGSRPCPVCADKDYAHDENREPL